MTSIAEDVVQVRIDGAVAELLIHRPESLNALNADVLQSIILRLHDLEREPDVRCIVLTGEGTKAFVAGADVKSMSQFGPRPIADYIELGQRTMRMIENSRLPVIAAINGYALGGGLELALSCDILLAAKSAKLGQPEVNLGIIPGFGGTQRLIQRCGIGTARWLVYSGELIGAEEALRIGLVDKIYEDVQLLEEARRMAKVISEKAPLAVAKSKQVIRNSQEGQLLSGLRLEVEGFLELFKTADREEGMTAFMQKRAPKFTGR